MTSTMLVSIVMTLVAASTPLLMEKLGELVAEKAGVLTVAKIDVDANPGTARDYQVSSIPTLILFQGGRPVKRIVGAKSKAALLRELADVV